MGLEHYADRRYIMNPSLTGRSGDNNGLTSSQCRAFYNPSARSGFTPAVVDYNCTSDFTGDGDSSSGSPSGEDIAIYTIIAVAGVLAVVLIMMGVARCARHRGSESQA